MSRLAHFCALLLTLQAWAGPPTPREVNALSVLVGARIVSAEGAAVEAGSAMLDGLSCSQYDPTLSQNGPLIIELAEPYDLSRLEVINSSNEEYTPGISVKTLRVERGAGPQGPWESLLEWTLQKGSEPQTRPVTMEKTRYLRVTLVANHGNKDWIALGELRAWGHPSASREIAFSGAWQTNYGELRLTQVGQRITGCYGSPNSQAGNHVIEGTLRESVFVGTWRELNEDRPATVGPTVFALTQEGDLSGVWGNTPSERTHRWDGTKLAKPTITCQKPKKVPPEENVRGGLVVPPGTPDR